MNDVHILIFFNFSLSRYRVCDSYSIEAILSYKDHFLRAFARAFLCLPCARLHPNPCVFSDVCGSDRSTRLIITALGDGLLDTDPCGSEFAIFSLVGIHHLDGSGSRDDPSWSKHL